MLYKVIFALIYVTATIADGTEPKPSGIIHYQRHVYHPTTNYFQETLSFPPSSKIVFHYTLTFNTTKCCPVVGYFQLINGLDKFLPGKGFFPYYKTCAHEDVERAALYSSYYIYGKSGFPNSGCHIVGTRTVCVGTRIGVVFDLQPMRWAFAAGYECKDQQNLDLTIDTKIEFTRNFKFICEPMQVSYCKDHFGYNLTAFPNAFGQEDPIQANRLFTLELHAASLFTCYQHFMLLMCRATFPECDNGRLYVPCLQMCIEFTEACRNNLRLANQPVNCEVFPDSLDPDICFYKPILCPTLQPPSFGSIFTEGHSLLNLSTYQCDEGYKLQGEAVRQCEASGKWNSSNPTCEPLYPTHSHKMVLISTFTPTLLLIVIVILCVYYYRKSIKILVLYNRFELFSRKQDEQKTMFIAYSSQDRDEVSQQFVPQLREQLRGWTVQTYQDDFVAGRNILECIKEGVWESQAVLVLLTENFVKSHWCLHEFIEAETRSAIDETFKLIVIIFTHDNQALPVDLLEDLPDSLKRYIRTRIYLPLWEPLFWNKLRQALSK